MYKQEKQAKIHGHRQQYDGYRGTGGGDLVKGKGDQIHHDRRFDFGGGHTVQYTGHVS